MMKTSVASLTGSIGNLEMFEGDTASVNAHLAVLAHIRGSLEARAEYIKRLPADKLNEVLEIITKL